MIYDLSNEFEREKFALYSSKLIEQGATVEIKKKMHRRTTSQNAYLHLILGAFALETGYTLEEVKFRLFKVEVNAAIFVRDGKFGQRVRSSAEIDTAEMTTAIDRFRNWASSNGVYLPAPNEHHLLQHIEKLIHNQKEHL